MPNKREPNKGLNCSLVCNLLTTFLCQLALGLFLSDARGSGFFRVRIFSGLRFLAKILGCVFNLACSTCPYCELTD